MFEYKIGKWNYNYSDYVKFESLIDNKLPFLTYIILLSVILDKPLNAPKFQILQTRYIWIEFNFYVYISKSFYSGT